MWLKGIAAFSAGAMFVDRGAMLAVCGAMLVGCGADSPPLSVAMASVAATPEQSQRAGRSSQKGRASYYSDSLAGNKTANGERYDPNKLTAAHRKLPFGTIVDVTRVKTGETVRVRINDRGPYAGKRRIIDLSRKGAETIGMIRAGVVDVELRIVSQPK